MREFKGPKYQQGKVGGFRKQEEPSAIELAKRIARKSKITRIELDGEDVLYIYANLMESSYPQSVQCKIIDNIKAQFEKTLPDTKVVVGFVDLHFTQISKKQAFAEKVAGTVK